MNIAYISYNFFAVSETFIRDLSIGLCERGHAVHFFASSVTDEGRRYKNNFASIDILSRNRASILTRLHAKYSEKVLKTRPDIYWGRRNLRHYQNKTYDLISSYNPEVLYADFGPNAIQYIELAQQLNIPLITHFHGFDLSSALRSKWYLKRLKILSQQKHPLIVPSHNLRRMLTIATGRSHNIHLIPYHPNHKTIPPHNRQLAKDPTIIALGRLTAKKNPLALVEAFKLVLKQVPDAHLEWIGDGPERELVEERIAFHKLHHNITLHGALEHKKALEIMSRGWVFAQHSVTAPDGDQEGLPVAIMEALAMKLPVVSTIHSGIPEAVTDGINGHLVREHDYESMAKRLIQVLTGKANLTMDSAFRTHFQPNRVEAIEKLMLDSLR